MRGVMLLAMRYMSFHRARTILLALSMAITMFIPLVMHRAVKRFEQQAMERAESTPLIIGKKGNRFGLAVHALYFRGDSAPTIPQSEWHRIVESKLAKAIPLHIRFRAGGYAIVGTTNDYLSFRTLVIDRGTTWQRLGDCILGSSVSAKLLLGPDDHLLSEPENAFDLSGAAPLNMRVVGVLKPTGTADDNAVFVDIKTAWIVEGIGHGHNIQSEANDEHLHEASRENLPKYNEVTDANVRSFHFHGNKKDFPLTTILAIPDSEKSEALLVGQYLDPDQPQQIIRPKEVIEELIAVIANLRKFMNGVVIVLALVELGLLVLVILLSLRLRAREMETMRLLGCSRGTMFRIVAVELMMVAVASIVVAYVFAWATHHYAMQWIESMAVA